MLTLNELVELITDKTLKKVCSDLVNDRTFLQVSAASSQSKNPHHAYTGGLAQHTREVATYALAMAKSIPEVNQDVLLTAAMFHDSMKVRQYKQNAEGVWIDNQPFKSQIYHIAASYSFWEYTAGGQVPGTMLNAISHCILAHHGHNPAWGSPVGPQTLEAYILHAADMLSANYNPDRYTQTALTTTP